ncbi:MAG: phosphoglycerate kinase [bacterium]|nr:phosphoglycerate kinase [bacterium]
MLPFLEAHPVVGRTVIFRVAYEVPLERVNGAWEVSDDHRIRATLETLQTLRDSNCSVVVVSYLGRPGGRVVPELSLKPVAVRLGELMGADVGFVPDCRGAEVMQAVRSLRPREVLMLENTRFHAEEEGNDPAFADELAALGDVCVFDAFAQAHRVHASTTGLVARLPTVFGKQFQKEIETFDRLLRNPEHPFVVVLGGAKIADKADVIEKLAKNADEILIGGAMAHPFLAARGVELGMSLRDVPVPGSSNLDAGAIAERLLATLGDRLQLPVDLRAASSAGTQTSIVDVEMGEKIPLTWRFVDLGPRTIEMFTQRLRSARTVLWNGPVGMFEQEPYALGTRRIAEAIAGNRGAVSIAGGGDTERALEEMSFLGAFSHVSTGGGAMLYYLAHGSFPVLDNFKSYEN